MKRTKAGLVELIAQTSYEVLSTRNLKDKKDYLSWDVLNKLNPSVAQMFRDDALPTADALIEAELVILDE